ncbi:MAG TPA: transcription antitermination factor NusB [Victivallales bacterium]|nr:transcription antitermination factor NusB [Victivallales bacterium]
MIHYRRYAREWTMQFLFQYDIKEFNCSDDAVKMFSDQLRETELYELPEKSVLKKAYKESIKLISGILEDGTGDIDKLISEYSSKWSIDRMDTVDRNIMRVAVYEMLHCDNVPPIVSINEAVEIGKKYGSLNTPSFINGVLNSIKNTLDRPARKAVEEE